MTGFLASVKNVDEAEIVFTAGADIIDLKDPSKGALGAVDHSTARTIVQMIDGRCLISATVGDLPMQPDLLGQAVLDMHATGVDIVKVGLFADDLSENILNVFAELARINIAVVLVIFADRGFDSDRLYKKLVRTGIRGVMLDTESKQSGRLTDIVPLCVLRSFIQTGKTRAYLTGLAGSLCLDDIQPLLSVGPDYLGFRGALCHSARRTESLNRTAVQQIRKQIPTQTGLDMSTRLISTE